MVSLKVNNQEKVEQPTNLEENIWNTKGSFLLPFVSGFMKM